MGGRINRGGDHESGPNRRLPANGYFGGDAAGTWLCAGQGGVGHCDPSVAIGGVRPVAESNGDANPVGTIRDQTENF